MEKVWESKMCNVLEINNGYALLLLMCDFSLQAHKNRARLDC